MIKNSYGNQLHFRLAGRACLISLVGAVMLARHGLVWVGVAQCASEVVLALGYLRVIVATLRRDEARG